METPIIGAIIIASAALIVGASNIIFKYWHARRERRIKAGKALIVSFEKTKKAIHEYNGYFYHWVNILLEHSENQQIVATEFKRHLGFIDGRSFNKAWNKYQGNNAQILDLTHFKAQDIQRILLSQIDEILKFTK